MNDTHSTWGHGLLLSALAAIAPIKAAVIVCGILVLADTITGIGAAAKRGEPIRAARMRRVVTKTLIYQAAILTSFLCERYLLDGTLPLSKLVSGIVGVVEMKSILENLDSISGGPLFQAVMGKLGSPNDPGKQVEPKKEPQP